MRAGRRFCLFLAVAGLWACSAPTSAPTGPLRVSAAVSLTESLTSASAAWEKSGGAHVELNFAASNVLARQILEGAPVDVFISADEAQMDRLGAVGLLQTGQRVPLLSNQLVVIVPTGRPLAGPAPTALGGAAVKRIAIGDPQGVPAGVYAKAWLERANLWGQVEAKVVPAASVRAALAAVESGNADAGIVYRTDARGRTAVSVAYEVPIADGPPIVYPAAVLKRTASPDAARRFLTYLESPQGRAVFADAGFLAPDAAAAR